MVKRKTLIKLVTGIVLSSVLILPHMNLMKQRYQVNFDKTATELGYIKKEQPKLIAPGIYIIEGTDTKVYVGSNSAEIYNTKPQKIKTTVSIDTIDWSQIPSDCKFELKYLYNTIQQNKFDASRGKTEFLDPLSRASQARFDCMENSEASILLNRYIKEAVAFDKTHKNAK